MHKTHPSIALLGYASGIAAGNIGCGEAPDYLQEINWLQELKQVGVEAHWQAVLYPKKLPDKYDIVADLSLRLADFTQQAIKAHQTFAVIGGDHSCAIGTWSGVAHALREQGDIGLIWIDAHLDSHTPQTTISGNIHGMPAATLLGDGDKRLTQLLDVLPKLNPKYLCFVGIRSYEPEESVLLEKLGVRIFYMDEIANKGLGNVFQEALAIVRKAPAGYGISLDLDVVDPEQAPGVGTPAQDGVDTAELYLALNKAGHDPQFLGCEINEFNPRRDHDHKTQRIMTQVMQAMFKC